MARGRAPGRGGLGRGGHHPPGRRRRGAGPGPQGDPRARRRGQRPRARHRPRRGRLRRRGPGGDRRARGFVGPLRAHVLRRRGHRAVRHPDARRRPAARRLGRAWCRCSRPGPSSSWTAPWRAGPTACTPSPPPSGPSWRCGACRPTATGAACAPRATPGGGGQAVGGGGHVLQHRPPRRGPRVRRPRAHARARHPGHRPRPPRRAAVGVRLGGCHPRDDRHRDPASGPDRGGRGRRGLRRGPEGQLGHAAQAQPDPVRAPERPGPRAARLSRGRARGRGAVARARHLPQLGGAGHPPRRLPAHLLRAAARGRARPEPRGPRASACAPT